MQLGEKIKHLRQSNKMSQSDLAKSLHVSDLTLLSSIIYKILLF